MGGGTLPKIPPVLQADVFRLAGEGKHSDEIAAWLATQGCVVCARTVRLLVRNRRNEQADVAKSVVRDELRMRLLPALRRVSRGGLAAEAITKRWIKKAREFRKASLWDEAATADEMALKAIDRQIKVADRLMHWAGIDQPDEPKKQSAQDKRKALLERLQKLAQEPSGSVAKNGKDPHFN